VAASYLVTRMVIIMVIM